MYPYEVFQVYMEIHGNHRHIKIAKLPIAPESWFGPLCPEFWSAIVICRLLVSL